MRKDKSDRNIRKEQILQASVEIISEYGVRGMSISNIAKAVGIVPSAIYRHYENKDEILLDIVKMFSQELQKLIEKAEEQVQNPLSRIKKVLFMHVQLMLRNRFFPVFMFSEEVFLDDKNLKRQFKGAFGKFLGHIAKYFSEAKEQNLIRPDISEQSLTMMYLGLFLPIAISLIVLGNEIEVISQVDISWDIFINGLKP